jgi:hypothetical protein
MFGLGKQLKEIIELLRQILAALTPQPNISVQFGKPKPTEEKK